MREDVKRALETARALPRVASNNTHGINQRLNQLEALFKLLPEASGNTIEPFHVSMESLCHELPGSARASFVRHLAHEGLLERDIELDTETLLSLSFLMSNNFNGLHAIEVLRLRGVKEVASVVEDHTLKVFVRLFGMAGIVHLDDELQAKGKRQCLEGDLSL